MTLRFGTDGVRGVANVELTPELVLSLGRAAAHVIGGPRFLIGRDTRRSGTLLEAALAAGLAAEGVVVERLGVLPTPGVARLSADEEVAAAVISASHNPFPDNGIKLFAAGGRKLSDKVEVELEAALDAVLGGERRWAAVPVGVDVGVVVDRHDAADRYVEGLDASLDGRRLDGIAVVVDCAHGAASWVGPEALRRLGADVRVVHAEPDGTNINESAGSTDPAALGRAVVEAGADAGLAFDGDADRVIAVDHRGEVVDGDHVIAICALDLRGRGLLRDDTVVVTVMTNLGFRRAMAEAGIRVVDTRVGDRYVLEALDEGGWSLGGEQSGHVIFRDVATTGDGILTGLQLLDVVRRRGCPLADLAAEAMTRLPQVLRNVPLGDPGIDVVAAVGADVAAVEADLGDQGRVLIRPSGTEPLVRIMVEAASPALAAEAADRLVVAVERAVATRGTPPQ